MIVMVQGCSTAEQLVGIAVLLAIMKEHRAF